MGEAADFAGLVLAILVLVAGGQAIRGHKWARRIFGMGLALIIIEAGGILLSGLNEKYFQSGFIEVSLKAYFDWLNLYLVFIVAMIFILVGLMLGLLAKSGATTPTKNQRE